MPATQIATTEPKRVRKGMKFNAQIRDGNPTFTVKRALRGGGWECVVEDRSDLDNYGLKKAFLGSDILNAVGYASRLNAHFQSDDQFWDAQKVGTIIHYHNGFGQFVRGEIILVNGKTTMKPVALVGKLDAWKHELPRRRMADGSPSRCYHADKIAEGIKAAWRPSTTCVYEAPQFSRSAQFSNPALDKPLDLSIPDLDGDAVETARLWQLRTAVSKALVDDGPVRADPRDLLRAAAVLLKDAGF